METTTNTALRRLSHMSSWSRSPLPLVRRRRMHTSHDGCLSRLSHPRTRLVRHCICAAFPHRMVSYGSDLAVGLRERDTTHDMVVEETVLDGRACIPMDHWLLPRCTLLPRYRTWSSPRCITDTIHVQICLLLCANRATGIAPTARRRPVHDHNW